MVLEELSALRFDPKAVRKRLVSRQLGELKAHPHSDILLLTRPHLLEVPFPGPRIFKHMNL